MTGHITIGSISTLVLAIVSVSTGFLYTNSTPASALSGSSFNPGRIIDDAVFYNNGSMTASQVQNFLNSKVPTCDTNGSQSAADWGYPSITHAQLAQYKREGSHGFKKDTGFHTPPYTCLKDYKQNTPQMEAASGLCGGLTAKSNRTAAQIIKDVSDACGINPQVLTVLLNKEQSLVTDTWPLNRQYTSATGFACPDTAPCDPAYKGFFYQVFNAARQFKVYKTQANNYNYIAGRTNKIYWQTNLGNWVNSTGNYSSSRSTCGYSNVYIQNQATAALYIYTPYRPNQKALANLYGIGDSCSAYGNRNFWRMFSDWFGSTQESFDYRSETLVGSGGVINRAASTTQASATVTIGTQIYTFYGDSGANSFRVSNWNGSKWTEKTIDGAGSSVPWSLGSINATKAYAFNYKGSPQVYYYDAASKSLRHAFMKSGHWAVETLDGSSWSIIGKSRDVGQDILGFQYGTTGIQLYYYNNTDKRLEHTWWDGKQWKNEVLDGASWGIIGRSADVGKSLAGFVYTNGIQLYYYNNTTKDLEHTWWDGKQWKNEVLDGAAGSIIGRTTDVGTALDAKAYTNNDIQLFYYDKTAGELMHTWWSTKNRRWSSETMDGDTSGTVLGNYIDAGKSIDVEVLNDKLFVLYYDDAIGFSGRTSAWRLAYWSGSTWIQHTLDGGENSESGSSAAIPLSDISSAPYMNKSLQIFYRGSSSQVQHFWVQK